VVGVRGLANAIAAAAVLLGAGLSPLPALAQAGGAGSLRGSVTDKDFEVPISGVRLTLVEARLATFTNGQGQFVFERVPAGTYTLTADKDGYERKIVTSVAVAPGRLSDLRIELASEVVDMEELVITGADLLSSGEVGILEVRAAATVIQDAISADLIKRAGVSDVTGALKMVTGTSIAEGKYATVRGLSDRYTGTTLNGVRVPSADPRRRAVQMDLFPTGTVDSITVTKTFTPNLSGDFTGGGVDIKTKGIPDGPVLGVTLSTDYDTSATGNEDFLSYEGGGVNLTGFGADSRALSARTDELPPVPPRFRSSPTPEEAAAAVEIDRYTRSFDPVMGTSTSTPGWNTSGSIQLGDRFTFANGGVLGVLGAFTWNHKYDFYEDGVYDVPVVSVAGQGFSIKSSRTDSKGTDELLEGVLGGLVYQPATGQNLSLTVLRNHSAEDEARFQVKDPEQDVVEQNQSLHYTERSVGSNQLHGDHLAGPWRLDWTLSTNDSRQQEPDVRFFRNSFVVDSFVSNRPANSTEPENTRRIWRNIEEDNWQLSGSGDFSFEDWTEDEEHIRLGFNTDRTNRLYEQRSFSYYFATQFPGSRNDPRRPVYVRNTTLTSYEGTPGQLWTDVFLSDRRIGLARNGPPAPDQILWYIAPLGDDVNYDGAQDIWAAFAMMDFHLARPLMVTAGVRMERTSMDIVPHNDAFGLVQVIVQFPSGDRGIKFVPEQEAVTHIRDTATLPSISFTWKLRSNMSVRSSWTQTIARPTFRELAPVATEEFLFGDKFVGNPDLTLSHIDNADLRWEWFPSSGSVLSAGIFGKKIRDPIELISFSVASNVLVQPVNYEKGRVKGFELEGRSSLSGLGRWASGFQGGMNFTWIDSQVDVPAAEQESLAAYGLDEESRRLLGQPKYLFNASLTWDHKGTALALFYNYVGETLRTGAARGPEDGLPNTFEKPHDTLDITGSQELGKHFRVGFKAMNLLRRDARTVARLPDGEEVIKTLRSTSSQFGVSAGWRW
jgi:outer membrane receptor protein involved in Fe transport